MNDTTATCDDLWPRWLRWIVVALGTLILCSCRAPYPEREAALPHGAPAHGAALAGALPHGAPPHGAAPHAALGGHRDTLPPEAFTGAAEAMLNPNSPQVLDAMGGWHPSGLGRPWPADEYIRDGGDYGLPARVRRDWTVEGLEQEDAIAHYDTLDGRRVVEPSNRVNIYAPRFGAVRRVESLSAHETHDRLAGFEKPTGVLQEEEMRIATTAVQPIQPIGEIGTRAASIYRGREQGGGLRGREGLAAFHDGFMPYENFKVIRFGIFDQAEKARLAERIQAAITWTSDQAVQVVLDRKLAVAATKGVLAEEVFRVEEPHSPALRIVKVASTDTARPGETVDFTLRFDNVGDQVIGNVTILDNLSTRLEYVPDSQQSSVDAEFFVEPNEGGSQVLRWEIDQPLEPGQGGIVRFRCLVR